VLATTIRVVDGVATTDVLDLYSFPAVGRCRHIDEGKPRHCRRA
jgi:hypothetical protein